MGESTFRPAILGQIRAEQLQRGDVWNGFTVIGVHHSLVHGDLVDVQVEFGGANIVEHGVLRMLKDKVVTIARPSDAAEVPPGWTPTVIFSPSHVGEAAAPKGFRSLTIAPDEVQIGDLWDGRRIVQIDCERHLRFTLEDGAVRSWFPEGCTVTVLRGKLVGATVPRAEVEADAGIERASGEAEAGATIQRRAQKTTDGYLDPAMWSWDEDFDAWHGPGGHVVEIDERNSSVVISDWCDVVEAPLDVVRRAVAKYDHEARGAEHVARSPKPDAIPLDELADRARRGELVPMTDRERLESAEEALESLIRLNKSGDLEELFDLVSASAHVHRELDAVLALAGRHLGDTISDADDLQEAIDEALAALQTGTISDSLAACEPGTLGAGLRGAARHVSVRKAATHEPVEGVDVAGLRKLLERAKREDAVSGDELNMWGKGAASTWGHVAREIEGCLQGSAPVDEVDQANSLRAPAAPGEGATVQRRTVEPEHVAAQIAIAQIAQILESPGLFVAGELTPVTTPFEGDPLDVVEHLQNFCRLACRWAETAKDGARDVAGL